MPGLKRHQSASVPPEAHRGRHRQGSMAPGAAGRPNFPLARDVESMIDENDEAASTARHTNTQAEEDDGIPLNEKTVLAITAFNGKIGCSYYNPYQRKLFLIEDSLDSSKYDFAINIIDQVKPHLTLVAERADDVLKEAIQAKLSQEIGDFTPVLEVRNGREFSASQGKAYLLDLPILNDNTDDDNNQYDEEMQDQDDDVINVGQEGLRNAYNFMRLRNKKKPRSQAATFLNTLKLGGCLTLESEKSLETVGCLLSYLNKRMNTEGELAGTSEAVDIIGIEMINLQKTMLINHDALHSLQIFEDETHANVHQKNKKEGLSLFGLLCRTKSPMGKAMLKRWLQQPSLEIPVLEARFDAVDCLSRTENSHISGSLQKVMNVKNVGRALKALQQNQNPVQQWQAIEGFLRACIVIRELIGELSGGKEVEVLQKLCESFDPTVLKELIHEIEDKIDWERSKENHRMCIREGVDEKLDNNRRSYNGLPSLLSRVAAAITEEIDPDFCTSLNVVYFPQLGYLLAVPLAEIAPEEYEDIHNEHGDENMAAGLMGAKAPPHGWQFQFSTEISVYYKNSKMRDLDRDIGDLHGFIVDREVELVQQLMVKVLEMEVTLTGVAEVLAELDCLLAFADATRQFEWTRPRVVESNAVRINEGRHPLVELCVDHFVRNDAQFVGGRGITPARLEEIQSKPDKRAILAAEKRHRLAKARKAGESTAEIEAEYAEKEHKMGEEGGEEEYSDLLSPDDSILILTGANASGKSVFLKTVAIIVYMAHIGCFVPAGEAIIGLTDKIMTRVSTRESVSRGTSAFMIDLQQVSFMLRNCTARSLLLVDEFGKGTNATDGAGLFVGLIKYLVTLGPDLPKCLLATHFHEIFFNSFLKSQLPIGLAHMELIVDREVGPEGSGRNNARDDDKVVGVTPLFRLAPGLCLRSYAYHCAASFGIGASIIERAMYVSQCLMEFELLEILDTTITPEEEERIKQSEEIVRRALTIEWDDEDGDEDDNGHYDQHSDYTMRKLAEILGEEYRGPGMQ